MIVHLWPIVKLSPLYGIVWDGFGCVGFITPESIHGDDKVPFAIRLKSHESCTGIVCGINTRAQFQFKDYIARYTNGHY